MKVGIDARFLTHPQSGGFKTYSENLIATLVGIDPENEYVLYVDRQPGDELPELKSYEACPNVRLQVVEGSMPMIGMLWREQVSLRRQANRDRVDLLHLPALTAPVHFNRPLVITLHDMIWRFPQRFSNGSGRQAGKRKLMEWYYRYIPELAARRAAALITVSQASRADILKHLSIPAGRVTVTPIATGPWFHPILDPGLLARLRQARSLPPEYMLAIGSADPRKNLCKLVEAYALLPVELRQRFPLVVVWTHHHLAGRLLELVESLGLAGQVHFQSSVSNEELALLYNGAALFVFPSLYEGFGLPLLEAMSCGTPVAAADNSSIPEVAGGAALLFNEQDPEDINRAIQQILSDSLLQQRLSKAGLERAAAFSWERTARETLAVYQKVAAR